MCKIVIRSDRGDFLTILLLGRSHPMATDYWDGNWVKTKVEVTAGGFRASVVGDLRTEEIARFHEQLVQLQESLRGTAELVTLEQWLLVQATGDGQGHIGFRCVIRDSPGNGNTLDCTLSTDQTFTQATIADLGAAVQAFSVIGKP
jgi:hypothetical protein